MSYEAMEEKSRRIYYQDIVHKVCNILDEIEKTYNPHTPIPVVCGTVDASSTEVQDRMRNVQRMLRDLDCGHLTPGCLNVQPCMTCQLEGANQRRQQLQKLLSSRDYQYPPHKEK